MDTKSLEQDLLDLEARYWRAMTDRDINAAVRLTDFPCVVSGPQGFGIVDELKFVDMMKTRPYELHRAEVGNEASVRMLSDDVAVIAYKVHEELTVDGKPVSLDANDSSTWVRRDGHWLCAFHSEALVGDPFGRDKARRDMRRPVDVIPDPDSAG